MNRRETVRAMIAAVNGAAARLMELAIDPYIANPYTENRYTNELYAAAAGYWKNGIRGNFISAINGTVKFGLTSAFRQGAAAVEVNPDEFSAEDKAFLQSIIDEEKTHVQGLLEFVDGLARDPKAKLADVSPRIEMWAKRFTDVISRAKIHFGGKRRLAWRLGEAEHCTTCLALSKIVAWAQEWEQADIRPKDQRLECHGYNCACEMEETTRRRSPKALQRILQAIGE